MINFLTISLSGAEDQVYWGFFETFSPVVKARLICFKRNNILQLVW